MGRIIGGCGKVWVALALVLGLCPGAALAEQGGPMAAGELLAASGEVTAQTGDAEPNDSPDTASAITMGETVSGSITETDSKDYYRFDLGTSGRVELAGTAYIENSRYRVYDANGQEVWSKEYNGWNSTTRRLDFDWEIDLTSGTYYLCIERYNSYTGPYSFRLSFESADEAFREGQGGSNNSFDSASAYTLGSECRGQIALNDDRDFYRFDLGTSGRVELAGTAYIENSRYRVYDANGQEVWSKEYNGWNSTTRRLDFDWEIDLTSGTYYLCIERYNSYTGPYSFRLSTASTAKDISSATVTLSPSSYVYDGGYKQPSVTVRYGGATLSQGTDYTVSYANNRDVGTATATVTGRGDYTGSKTATFVITPATSPGRPMHRLYNPNSGEHFYTASDAERGDLVWVGWRYEGVAWSAPETSSTPVYRLYNPNSGDHHYTVDSGERDFLVAVGWHDEGVGWYSDDSRRVPLLRAYNPNAATGSHNYTASQSEQRMLISAGWHDEGIGWYGI